MTAVSFNHPGQKRPCHIHGRQRVHIHRQANTIRRLLLKKAIPGHNTGIIDEHIYSAMLAYHLLSYPGNLFGIGEVDPVPVHRSQSGIFPDNLVEAFLVDIKQNEGRPILQHHPAHNLSDAGGSSGDKDTLIPEILHVNQFGKVQGLRIHPHGWYLMCTDEDE